MTADPSTETATNPFVDEWGRHLGYCNGCDNEAELSSECQFCEDGEIVPYDDDPDPDEFRDV